MHVVFFAHSLPFSSFWSLLGAKKPVVHEMKVLKWTFGRLFEHFQQMFFAKIIMKKEKSDFILAYLQSVITNFADYG